MTAATLKARYGLTDEEAATLDPGSKKQPSFATLRKLVRLTGDLQRDLNILFAQREDETARTYGYYFKAGGGAEDYLFGNLVPKIATWRWEADRNAWAKSANAVQRERYEKLTALFAYWLIPIDGKAKFKIHWILETADKYDYKYEEVPAGPGESKPHIYLTLYGPHF